MKNTHYIIQADCMDTLRKIPDNAIDFICSDFPYNISWKGWLTMKGNKIVKVDFWDWNKRNSQAEYLDFVFSVITQYKRILKPSASMVLFFGYRQAGWIAYELERRKLFTFRTPIILNKTNPQPSYKKNSFRSCYEMGLWLVNDNGNYNKPRTFNFLSQDKMKNVLHYKIGKEWNKQSKHPTEKPQDLISTLIEVFTNKWHWVFDSFAWLWTTGIASCLTGRNALSIEKAPSFIQVIKQRQRRVEYQTNTLISK